MTTHETCPPWEGPDGTTNDDCGFFAYASDGHRYVWAATHAGEHRVEAFDIDTGDYVGYIPTCSTPMDLDYHPGRREMLVRCAGKDAAAGHDGEIDVFSVDSLGNDYTLVSLNDTQRPYGRLEVHSTMGPYAYSSAFDQPYIAEIDLSTRTVKAQHVMPNAYGGYDMAYSPVNRHVYVRARVCCTCGFPGADQASCGRDVGRPTTVLTGPSAGRSDLNGTCSGGCEGSKADTIGVYEFDTVNKRIVGSINIDPQYGQGADPVASPDGRYILLFGNDGGKAVRVVKPNQNGQPSVSSTILRMPYTWMFDVSTTLCTSLPLFADILQSVVHDIVTDFKGARSAIQIVVSDFAFVTDDNRDILVLGSSTDNDIVLVDLKSYQTRKLSLTGTTTTESTAGNARHIEWAVGTDYVWVSGGSASEMYIVEFPSGDINAARIAKTIGSIPSGEMIFVENYERKRTMQMIQQVLLGTQPDGASSDDGDSQAAASALGEDDNETSDTISVVALVVGCIALILAVGATVKSFLLSPSSSSSPSAKAGSKDASNNNGGEPTDCEADVDVKTLGSKAVA